MFENFWLLVSQRFGDKKIGFNSCVKFLNIANFDAFHVCHITETHIINF